MPRPMAVANSAAPTTHRPVRPEGAACWKRNWEASGVCAAGRGGSSGSCAAPPKSGSRMAQARSLGRRGGRRGGRGPPVESAPWPGPAPPRVPQEEARRGRRSRRGGQASRPDEARRRAHPPSPASARAGARPMPPTEAAAVVAARAARARRSRPRRRWPRGVARARRTGRRRLRAGRPLVLLGVPGANGRAQAVHSRRAGTPPGAPAVAGRSREPGGGLLGGQRCHGGNRAWRRRVRARVGLRPRRDRTRRASADSRPASRPGSATRAHRRAASRLPRGSAPRSTAC